MQIFFPPPHASVLTAGVDRFPYPPSKSLTQPATSAIFALGVHVSLLKLPLVLVLSLLFAMFGSAPLAIAILAETMILILRIMAGSAPVNYEFATVKAVAAVSRYVE